jgi:hypothetical protein
MAAAAHGNVDPIRPGSNAQLSNGDPDLPFTYTTRGLHAIHYLRVIEKAQAALDSSPDPA